MDEIICIQNWPLRCYKNFSELRSWCIKFWFYLNVYIYYNVILKVQYQQQRFRYQNTMIHTFMKAYILISCITIFLIHIKDLELNLQLILHYSYTIIAYLCKCSGISSHYWKRVLMIRMIKINTISPIYGIILQPRPVALIMILGT